MTPSFCLPWERARLKVPQEENTTRLKGAIVIQLEKRLPGTSELIPARYDSACAVYN